MERYDDAMIGSSEFMANQVTADDITDRLNLSLHLERLVRLCDQCKVKRLDIFGSATTTDFDPATSDLDFLVAFEEIRPSAYVKAYFGLLEGLVETFQRPVDLVTDEGLRNPHFVQRIETESFNLYTS